MKSVIIALIAFFAVTASVSAQNAAATTAKKETQKTMYCCPMHPNETSMEKGKCPKCGMDFVKTTTVKHDPAIKGSQTSVTVKKEYICKMDGTTSDKPGKCPKCGMDFVKTTELKHNPAVKGSQTSVIVKKEYICKMDGTTSDKPGKCPKCGMKMTEKKVDTKEMKH